MNIYMYDILISSEKLYLLSFLGQCYMHSLLSEQQDIYWEGERTWSYNLVFMQLVIIIESFIRIISDLIHDFQVWLIIQYTYILLALA